MLANAQGQLQTSVLESAAPGFEQVERELFWEPRW